MPPKTVALKVVDTQGAGDQSKTLAPPPRVYVERHSFTLPPDENAALEQMIGYILIETGIRLNRSETVRLGLKLIKKVTPAELAETCLDLPRFK